MKMTLARLASLKGNVFAYYHIFSFLSNEIQELRELHDEDDLSYSSRRRRKNNTDIKIGTFIFDGLF